MIKLILSNQILIRLYIEFYILNDLTRFRFFKFFRFFVKIIIRLDSSRFYYFIITILNHFETNVVVNHNTRLFSNYINEFIDIIDFDHENVAFRVFCEYLLRILSRFLH